MNSINRFLRDIEKFIHNEHKLYEKHSELYEAVPDSRPPKQRGRNRTNKIFRFIRTIVNWAIDEELTTITSFPKFTWSFILINWQKNCKSLVQSIKHSQKILKLNYPRVLLKTYPESMITGA